MPANQADNETTPQYRQKKKYIEQEKKRKNSLRVTHTWVELTPDKTHKFGGKVVLRRQLNNGNVHTIYLGREKK